MGLESATYIHQLDPSNPVGATDPKSQGDNHLRMLKSSLQNTFPNIAGQVTASHTELNQLDGFTLASGVYVPSFLNISNVASVSFDQFRYMRLGNIVLVQGRLSVTTTLSSAGTFRMSTPIARGAVFASSFEAGGFGTDNVTSSSAKILVGAHVGDNNTVSCSVQNSFVGTMFFTYNLV